MRQSGLPLPATEYGPEGRRVVWKLPVYNTLHHMLTNPVYAGAYAFGRTGSRVTIEAGRKRVARFRSDRDDWEVLICDHHEGYIGWAEFERNQRLISDNANGKSFLGRGSVRRGEALLAGLLRCGHCGRKLHVAYSGENGSAGRYHCKGGHLNHGGDRCISFGGMRIDRAVGNEVVERLQPLGVEAAIGAPRHSVESAEKRRQVELALEQARYEAARARRQYDAVDPDNRLVAGELERRWNDRLIAVRALEDERDAVAVSSHTAVTEAQRDRLLALGADVESAPAQSRRDAGDARVDHPHPDRGDRGAGGGRRPRPESGGPAATTRAARAQEPRGSAPLGNRRRCGRPGHRTRTATAWTWPLRRSPIGPARQPAAAKRWTRSRVCSLRNHRGIPAYREGERTERGEVTLDEAATVLQVSEATVRRLIQDGCRRPRSTAKALPG